VTREVTQDYAGARQKRAPAHCYGVSIHMSSVAPSPTRILVLALALAACGASRPPESVPPSAERTAPVTSVQIESPALSPGPMSGDDTSSVADESQALYETSANDFPPLELIAEYSQDTVPVEEALNDTVSSKQVFDDAYARYERSRALIGSARLQIDTALVLLDTISDEAGGAVMADRDEMVIELSRVIRQLVVVEDRRDQLRNDELPLQMNKFVEREITSFQGRERARFLLYYERSGAYIQLVRRALREERMPERLAWLPFIESGFSTSAYSTARALGLWQFIASTGHRYGLNRDRWRDQRRDFESSTRAALAYLRDLHGMFGDWNTALAAYNCGEGRVLRTINRQRDRTTDDFWDLFIQLPRETARYVPRLHAVLHILNDPAAYGFDDLPEPKEPLAWDTVATNKEMALKSIARHLSVTTEQMKRLNPELKSKPDPITPPYAYTLRVPAGKGESARLAMARIPVTRAPELPEYVTHRVRYGQTLGTIARRYRTSIRAIMRANRLRSAHRIYAGQRLKVPTRAARSSRRRSPSATTAPRTTTSGDDSVYVVRAGDTLWSISRQHSTTITRLRRMNSLGRTSRIYPGQKIVVSRTSQ
jgi:membrane-bound lytic murein transglycosylase D